MKAFLSIFLGFMLLTSLVGISYATPIVQPAQGSGSNNNGCVLLPPNNPNYDPQDCHGAHQGGNDDPPHHIHACFDGRIGPDVTCACNVGITPHSLEISDIHADQPCES